MSPASRKLSRFWFELRRRNVLRSVAVYAGSAFIILEAATIIFPRWGLPDWTIDLVLYLLIMGAAITIVVSWIFDITPQGVQKTKPITESEETRGAAKAGDSNSWKVATYISLVVIVGLVVLNVIPNGREAQAGTIDSMVILPFDNFTGDDQLEGLVSGMHSMLIGDVGRIAGLRVISPTTANVYKNAEKSVPEIANELNVRAVLDLDVMCLGDSICFQAKVITPFPEEKVLWIADYKEEKSQMLNLYNRITKQIAEEVRIELSPGEEQILAQSRTVDPEAIDAYLMGDFYRERLAPEFMDSAEKYFQIAIEKDPGWAEPYIGMAQVWGERANFGFGPYAEGMRKRYEYLDKALELDPNSWHVHALKAGTEVWTEWNLVEGEQEFLKALELNPNDALTRVYYAHLLMILGRTDEALEHAELALKLDPMKPLLLGLYAVVMHYTGDYQSERYYFEKALSIDPENLFAMGNITGSYIRTGDTLKWHEFTRTRWSWSDDSYPSHIDSVFREGGYRAVLEERIRINEEVYNKTGLISYTGQVHRYLEIGDNERAMDLFEQAYEIKLGLLSYLPLYVIDYPVLKNNPRYIALLKKMNLPLKEDILPP